MIRRMLACLPLLAVAPDRSHGVAWRLLALLIPLVRALARRSGGPGVRMVLGATLADGVVDTRSDALVRHGPVSQMWRRASGYRNVGDLTQTWQLAPVAQSSMLQVNDTHTGTGLGCRPRSEFISPGTAPACSRPGPRSRFVPQASGHHVFTG